MLHAPQFAVGIRGGHAHARRQQAHLLCPLQQPCVARQTGDPQRLPVKTRRLKRSRRESDWLLLRWRGRVWLNPPYGQQDVVGPWMRRMAEHGNGTALIFARTETEIFFETVWLAAKACLFLEGRLHFHYPDGSRAKHNGGAPSVLVAYGSRDAERLARCGLRGYFVRCEMSAQSGILGG